LFARALQKRICLDYLLSFLVPLCAVAHGYTEYLLLSAVSSLPKLPALRAPAPGPAQAVPQQPFPLPPGGFSYAVVAGQFKDYNSSFGVLFHADTVQCDPGNVVSDFVVQHFAST
jgi:hypothetical protein